MDPSPPKIKLKRLSRASLEVPLGAGMRLLPAEDRKVLQARREALHERTRPLGSAMQWRLRHYVLLSVICVPLVLCLFMGAPLSRVWITVPLAALYGVGVAVLRPSEHLAGWMLVLVGAVGVVGTGRLGAGMHGLLTVLGFLCLYVLGMCVGVGETLRRTEGE